MEKSVIIAPVGDNLNALFIGIKNFPTEKVILLVPADRRKEAEQVQKDLGRFRIPADIIELRGNLWEELFVTIGRLKAANANVMVNVATGDRNMQCAATSAAFVNGVKAISIEGDEAMLLPILKFNYYKLLSDKKMRILQVLYDEQDCCSSLEQLSRKVKMSLPLISYHINGSRRSEGLKEMGLVETTESRGRVGVSLSMLGRLLVKGYVSPAEA